MTGTWNPPGTSNLLHTDGGEQSCEHLPVPQVAYFGDRGQEAIEYFQHHNPLAETMGEGANEAEWIVDITTEADRHNRRALQSSVCVCPCEDFSEALVGMRHRVRHRCASLRRMTPCLSSVQGRCSRMVWPVCSR